HRPWCVSGGVRSDPAVGEHLCPIRARVLVGDGGPTAVRASVTAAGTRRWEASSVLSWRAPQQPRAEAVYLCVRRGRRSRSAEGLVEGQGLGDALEADRPQRLQPQPLVAGPVGGL